MRILMFAAYFYPHKGGHEKYAEEIAAHLVENGHEVDIVTSRLKDTNEFEIYRGISIYRVPSWEILGKTYPIPKPNIFSKIPKKNHDVVITHTRFFFLSVVGALFAKKNKIFHLHIEHGTCHPKTKALIRPLVLIYDYTLGHLVFHLATKVGAVSKASADFVNSVCKRNSIILPNAINTSFFAHRKSKRFPSVLKNQQFLTKQKVKKPWTEKTIAFVGRLIEAKGVQDLITATKDMKNVKVIIIGAGNYDSALKNMAHENVVFVGEKNAKEVREILSYSDLFVNPSYAEGLPTSVLEAGAIGLPTIATDVGGTKEIIDNTKNGFLISPKDVPALKSSIEWILKNPKKAKEMGKLLRKKVQTNFDWKMTAKKVEQVLEEWQK